MSETSLETSLETEVPFARDAERILKLEAEIQEFKVRILDLETKQLSFFKIVQGLKNSIGVLLQRSNLEWSEVRKSASAVPTRF